VQDDAGNTYIVSEYTSSRTISAFNEPAIQIDEPGGLFLNGQVVNNLGDGRYQVVDTGLILHERR
jgi:hypothetical protein